MRAFVAAAICLAASSASAQTIRSATGPTRADVQSALDLYRTDLGVLRPNVAGSFLTGRREIQWDSVPDIFATPSAFPADYFNATSVRGVVLSTPGTELRVSAATGNNAGTPVNFADINPLYAAGLAPFSGSRMFAAMGNIRSEVRFFIPGTTTPGLSRGFGAVFSDVDEAGLTRIDLFGPGDILLASIPVPATRGDATFSFAGASFATPVVAYARIIAGTVPLGQNTGSTFGLPTIDVVAMNDFVYGEPVPAPATLTLLALGAVARRRSRR